MILHARSAVPLQNRYLPRLVAIVCHCWARFSPSTFAIMKLEASNDSAVCERETKSTHETFRSTSGFDRKHQKGQRQDSYKRAVGAWIREGLAKLGLD